MSTFDKINLIGTDVGIQTEVASVSHTFKYRDICHFTDAQLYLYVVQSPSKGVDAAQ